MAARAARPNAAVEPAEGRTAQRRRGLYRAGDAGQPEFSNTGGAFYGGALALFADYAVHGAIQTTTPSATSWATLDFRIRFVRPIIPDGRPLLARARVVHRGRRLAVAWVEIVTADQKVAALADASAMLLPRVPWHIRAAPIDERPPDNLG